MIGAAGTCVRIAFGGVVVVCAALYGLSLYAGGLTCAATPTMRFVDSIAAAERSLIQAFGDLP